MAIICARFFAIIGLDFVPPTNLAELIPYLLTIVVTVALVAIVAAFIGRLFGALCSFRRL